MDFGIAGKIALVTPPMLVPPLPFWPARKLVMSPDRTCWWTAETTVGCHSVCWSKGSGPDRFRKPS
jgi:hypothetical protein